MTCVSHSPSNKAQILSNEPLEQLRTSMCKIYPPVLIRKDFMDTHSNNLGVRVWLDMIQFNPDYTHLITSTIKYPCNNHNCLLMLLINLEANGTVKLPIKHPCNKNGITQGSILVTPTINGILFLALAMCSSYTCIPVIAHLEG